MPEIFSAILKESSAEKIRAEIKGYLEEHPVEDLLGHNPQTDNDNLLHTLLKHPQLDGRATIWVISKLGLINSVEFRSAINHRNYNNERPLDLFIKRDPNRYKNILDFCRTWGAEYSDEDVVETISKSSPGNYPPSPAITITEIQTTNTRLLTINESVEDDLNESNKWTHKPSPTPSAKKETAMSSCCKFFSSCLGKKEKVVATK